MFIKVYCFFKRSAGGFFDESYHDPMKYKGLAKRFFCIYQMSAIVGCYRRCGLCGRGRFECKVGPKGSS